MSKTSGIITRKQYMGNSKALHKEYYEQFASDAIIQYVVGAIGRDRINAALLAGDEHLNTIPLAEWDQLRVDWYLDKELWKDAELTTYSKETQLERPFIWSMSCNVCIAKAAAKKWHDSQKEN